MKHNLKPTIILLSFFLIAQFIGIFVLYNSIDFAQSQESGVTIFKELPVGERPPIEEQNAYWSIIGAIIIGTLLLLLLIKLKWTWVWKIWFLLAVFVSLSISFGTFIKVEVAVLLALGLAAWKVFRPNFWIHNFTELFIYAGLATIFVPVLNLWSVSILLILIAIYDAYAVWQSKHMITLAKSQTDAKVFAGLFIPYDLSKSKIHHKIKSISKTAFKTASKTAHKSKVTIRTAILGGGDIGFPLIFAGVILKEIGLWQSLIIPFFAFAGLGLLLWFGDEKKFYPAMPFIGAACFIGLGVVYFISLFL